MFKNRFKRSVCMMLVIVMVLSMLPISAAASGADGSSGEVRVLAADNGYMGAVDATIGRYGYSEVILDLSTSGVLLDWDSQVLKDEAGKPIKDEEGAVKVTPADGELKEVENEYTASFWVSGTPWNWLTDENNKRIEAIQRPIGIRVIDVSDPSNEVLLAECGLIFDKDANMNNRDGDSYGYDRLVSEYATSNKNKLTGGNIWTFGDTAQNPLLEPGSDLIQHKFLQGEHVRNAVQTNFDNKKGAYMVGGRARVLPIKALDGEVSASGTIEATGNPDLLWLGRTDQDEPVYFMYGDSGPGKDDYTPGKKDNVHGCYGMNGQPCKGSFKESISDAFLISMPAKGGKVRLEYTYEVTSPAYYYGGRNYCSAVWAPNDYKIGPNTDLNRRWHHTSLGYIWYMVGESMWETRMADGTVFQPQTYKHYMVASPELASRNTTNFTSKDLKAMVINGEPALPHTNYSFALKGVPTNASNLWAWWLSPYLTLGMGSHGSTVRLNNNYGIAIKKTDPAKSVDTQIPMNITLKSSGIADYLDGIGRLFCIVSNSGQDMPEAYVNETWLEGEEGSLDFPLAVQGWAKIWVTPNYDFRVTEASDAANPMDKNPIDPLYCSLDGKPQSDFMLFDYTGHNELNDSQTLVSLGVDTWTDSGGIKHFGPQNFLSVGDWIQYPTKFDASQPNDPVAKNGYSMEFKNTEGGKWITVKKTAADSIPEGTKFTFILKREQDPTATSIQYSIFDASGQKVVDSATETDGVYVSPAGKKLSDLEEAEITLTAGQYIALKFEGTEASIYSVTEKGTEYNVSVAVSSVTPAGSYVVYSDPECNDGFTGGSSQKDDEPPKAYFNASGDETATLTFNNSNQDLNGPAHLIIDYNLNGVVATDEGDTSISSDSTLDCGAHNVGDSVTISPKLNGTPVTKGSQHTFQAMATVNGNSQAVNVTATCKGIFTQASGGTEVTGSYTISKPGLNVLYAQWDFSMDINVDPGSGGGGEPTGGGDLITVFWDKGYYGGGITSSTFGKIKIPLKLKVDAEGDSESGSVSASAEASSEVEINIGFSAPWPVMYGGSGSNFRGWTNDPDYSGGPVTYPRTSGNYDAYVADLAKKVTKSQTLYAVYFVSAAWDANGGCFDSSAPVNKGTSIKNQYYNVIEEYDSKTGFASKLTCDEAQSSLTAYIPLCEMIPTREGYSFTQWYFDKKATTPLTETQGGVMPYNTYYAGWTPDKVIVNYYDTRENGKLVGSQEYKYDDYLTLLSGIVDTSGQEFVAWKTKDGAQINSNKELDSSILTRHENAHDGSDGMVDRGYYWTLDLYTDWNPKTVDYTATLVYNDYQNNDGSRPKEITLGLVSSVTNREVGSKTITVDKTGNSQEVTFSSLPVTTSESSVEKVTYKVYIKDYTDIDNDKYVIQDTSAQSGMLDMAAVSAGSTTPRASYSYALNNISHGDAYDGTVYLNHNIIETGEDIKFNIIWQDDSNNDGYRPSAVTLTLYANGEPVETFLGSGASQTNPGKVSVNSGMCDVSADGNSWTYTFKDYQKYKDGLPITYSVVVSDYNNEHYALAYAGGSGSSTYSAVLTHKNDKRVVPVSIRWNDNNNRDGHRPSKVDVALMANQYNAVTGSWENVQVGSKTLEGSPTAYSWDSSFEGMKVYNGGKEIIYYAVVESDLNALLPEGANPYTSTNSGTCITISHLSDTKGVTATVRWDDDNNNDGIRPGSVLLELYADGKPITEAFGIAEADWRVILSGDPTADEWTYYYEDLPVFASGESGRRIVYSLKVSEAETGDIYGSYTETGSLGEAHTFTRYTASYPKKGGAAFTDAFGDSAQPIVRLTHKANMIEVPASIVWDDMNNRDGQRPNYVTLALTAYQWNSETSKWETVEVATQTVNAGGSNTMTADRWTATFGYHEMYHDGQKIIYHLSVESDLNVFLPEGAHEYDWAETAYGNQVDAVPQVTISQNMDTRDVTATIQWNDRNDNDGIRPGSVILELYADGEPITSLGYAEADCRVVLSGDTTADEWTYTYKDMPAYTEGESGHRIIYTVKVSEAKAGDIYGDYTERGVLGEAHTFAKYAETYPDADGNFMGDFAASTQPVARLTHEINQIEVPVSVIWNDMNNRDGQRPDYVTLALTAYQWNRDTYKWEYVETATQTVKTDDTNTMTADEWTATFGLRDMYHDGLKVIYHLAITSNLNEFLPEGSPEYGWVKSAHGNQVDAVPQVTVSQNLNTTSAQATVYWDDSQNNDNIRPQHIILQLYAHAPGETPEPVKGLSYRVTLSGDPAADNWTYTFSGMPKYAAGQSGVELIYTVRAIEAEGEPLYGYYIITANGEEEEILRYEASYLHENGGATESTMDADLSDRAYVKLSHITETKTMNFSVNWHDGDNRDNVRPSSVPASLYKTVGDGEPVYLRAMNITAGKSGTWTQKVTDLPGYEDGKSVKYTVQVPEDAQEQLAASGYTVTVQDNIIHMYYTPRTGSISMKLYWSDNEDNDGYRPDSVIATLYANGVSTGKTIDLNGTNDWSATWTDLDAHYVDGTATGTDVVYSVRVEQPEGYAAAYEPESTTIDAGETLYVRLTHEGDTADVPVKIYWNDQGNNDGKRPETLTVQLLADGQPTDKTLTLDAGNADGSADVWSGTFEDMPVYGGDGRKIYYSLKVYDGTVTTGGYDLMTAGTTLYLSYKPVKSAMYVSFQFDDGNNTDGQRPTGLYLQLTANGVPVGDSEYKHTVSFDANVDGYTWDFGELPVYAADNTKIAYNVVVTLAPELGATDYSVWTSEDIRLSESGDAAKNQIIVKLKRAVDDMELTGHVYWFDCNNVEGNRPDMLNIVVTDAYSGANVNYRLNAKTGTVTKVQENKVVGTVNVAEWTGDSSVWTYTISGLRKNYLDNAGKISVIYYYTKGNTAPIAMYYPTVYHGEDYGMDIALTHKDYETYATKASQDYTVDIMWLDNSDAWGLRPDSGGVKVDLLANGRVYDTIILTQADAKEGNPNAWTHVFKNIPTYRNGGAIVWSVALCNVDKYVQKRTVSTATSSTFRFTQAIGFKLTANWEDSDNDDAVRPESITVVVYGDGAPAGTVTLTGKGNTWTGSISGLPVWRESDSDAAVQYTFLWDEATEQYLSGKGYTASPTAGGQDAQSSRFYWLSTEAFGDHEAEGFDALAGTYDWETTLRYQQEKADYHFTVTFDDDADRDGIRPDTVKVELLANGEVIDTREIAVNASESMYDLAWERLDVNEAGEAIAYTIRLVDTPKGYTAGYNTLNTSVTLTHNPDTITVTGTVNWDDSTQLVDVYNANGTYVRSYEQIQRTGVYVRLLADGEPCGEPVFIPKSAYGEGEKLEPSAIAEWTGLYKYRDGGTAINYTMEVYSDELTALLDDGHSLTYDFGTKYAPKATVTHDLYDIRGSVYYMYDYSGDFLLPGVPVTAYLQGADGSYKAMGSTVTGEDGTFELLNLPQGLYIIRATYQYGGNVLAGTKGVELDRKDASTTVIIDREAVNDSDRYHYAAGGAAYYQTDAADDSTVKPVPEGSVVLLYRLEDGKIDPVYVGMTTTDAAGRYRFEDLVSADYVVNVVFYYDGGTYTYDNGDALADGLSFNVLGADMIWPDIVKQVNAQTDIKDPDDPENPPVDPPEKPEPCIVSGDVFYADGGVHTTDPVVGADVYVYLSSNAEVGHAVTDENGRWSVEGLAAENYIAVFGYQGCASRVLLFTVTEADYEAGTYEAATQYFDRTTETPSGTVKGVVLDENGQTMRALVGIYNANGTLLDFAYTDTYGRYSFTVAAGYDYNVRILAVEDEVERLNAGDPDDALTTLDYYELSGVFAVDGAAQAGKLVAVYYEQDGEYSLVTATLTDGDGKFAVKVYDEGNYKVCPYVNDQTYETRYVSVGYQEERPSVSSAVNGSYTVSGIEDYDSLTLYKVTGGVETTVREMSGGSSYEIGNLDAGDYRLKLTKGGRETWYYFTCPEGTLVDVAYCITVGGSVLDESGKAVTGAKAEIYDAEGKPAGEPVTILSDGGYAWHELPEGKYTVVVTKPNTSAVIADKWTHEPDSYGVAYEGGMAPSGTWTWNINAHVVSGKVTDQKGEPIVGAYVTFENGLDAGSRFVAITGTDGTYSIGLAPGEYGVSAVYHWDAAHTYNATGTIHQKVEQDVSGVDFTIARHELTIEAVRMADGTPAPGADLEVRYEDGTLFWTGKADNDGKAAVTVFPGKYLISGKYDGSGTAKAEATVTGDMEVVLKLDSVVYITGTVRDGDGNPVPDGLVYYDNGKGNSGHVYTNDEGYYEIPVASDALGDYEIYAAQGTAAGEKTTINVLTDVVLDLLVSQEEMPEDYVISGVVTDEDGNRLANTMVTMTWGNDKANKVTTSTNSKGEYTFTVADGTYYLTAAYEADNGEVYETNSEAVVHVNGADATKNLVILVGYEVEVTVVDANGDPVDGATVYYQGAASGEAGTGPDGTVSLHLPKGDYQFWAETTNRSSDTAELTVDGPESLTLELEIAGISYEEPEVSNNGQTIWGFVHDPDGMPVEGASVELYRLDLETLEWSLVDSAGTDTDGRYEFSGLEDGTYRVDTVHTYETEADMSEDGWIVAGTVTDDAGDPLSNCRVELWTEGGDLIAEVTTGEDGEYAFEGVDPDESYVVKAWDASEEPVMDESASVTATSTVISGTALDVAGNAVPGAKIEILDAEGNTMATAVADETGCYSVAVDGNPGYRVVMELPASYEVDTETYERDTTDRNAPYLEPSWYTIEGYVHDNDGKPVEGAEVVLTGENGEEVDRHVTEADGYYVFDHLADGVYHVHVVSPDGSERDYTVKTGDDANNINVVITNYSKGTVTEPDGGWYDGWNSFTVECNLACLVYVKDADGGMTKLEAEATDENNIYRFTADLSEGDEIIVLVRGDSDLDGKLTVADLVCLSRYFGGMYDLSAHAALAADTDLDGRLTVADLVCLSRYFGGMYKITW